MQKRGRNSGVGGCHVTRCSVVKRAFVDSRVVAESADGRGDVVHCGSVCALCGIDGACEGVVGGRRSAAAIKVDDGGVAGEGGNREGEGDR